MLQSKVLVAAAAFGVVAAFVVASAPAQAGNCAVITVKARGLSEAAANKRAHAKLTRYVNHWAHKNKLKSVHVGYSPTSCGKGPVFVCTASAKACP